MGDAAQLPRSVDVDPEPCPVGVWRPVAAGAYQRVLGAGDGAQRVGGDRGPDLAGMAQLQDVPGERVPVPVPGPSRQHIVYECVAHPGIRRRVEREVQESGPGDLDPPDPGAPATRSRRISATSSGRPRGGPGQLERDGAGVVPATAGPCPLHSHARGHGRAQGLLVDRATHGAQHGPGELGGGHGTSVWEGGGRSATRFRHAVSPLRSRPSRRFVCRPATAGPPCSPTAVRGVPARSARTASPGTRRRPRRHRCQPRTAYRR